MEQYQLRVIEEKTQLDLKIANLQSFLQGSMMTLLPSEDQSLLRKQSDLMTEYSKILEQRIARFKKV